GESSHGTVLRGRSGDVIPALATRRSACGLVVTRGTPPREEGCRPANRGFTLALMTCVPGCARGTRRVNRWSRRLGWRDAVGGWRVHRPAALVDRERLEHVACGLVEHHDRVGRAP